MAPRRTRRLPVRIFHLRGGRLRRNRTDRRRRSSAAAAATTTTAATRTAATALSLRRRCRGAGRLFLCGKNAERRSDKSRARHARDDHSLHSGTGYLSERGTDRREQPCDVRCGREQCKEVHARISGRRWTCPRSPSQRRAGLPQAPLLPPAPLTIPRAPR